MGKAVKPLRHSWDGGELSVYYAEGLVLRVGHIKRDLAGRLWAHVTATAGDTVVNTARLDLLQ